MEGHPVPRIIPPGGGRRVRLGMGRPSIKIGLRDGATHVGVFESELPPGGGFRVPHWHDESEEVFYVLDGEIEYLLGDHRHREIPGSTVFVPPGTVHAFRNSTALPASHLVIGSAELISLVEDLGEVEPDEFEAVHERYRSHFAHSSPHFPGQSVETVCQ